MSNLSIVTDSLRARDISHDWTSKVRRRGYQHIAALRQQVSF